MELPWRENKLKMSKFYDDNDPNVFLDWEENVEQIFNVNP